MEGLTADDLALIERIHAEALTMCNPNRCKALARECRRVLRDGVPGDFVLTGVWRGGLAILAASIFAGSGRRLYLYDTFEGMTRPGPIDGAKAALLYGSTREVGWCKASRFEVLGHIASYGLQDAPFVIVAGDVVQTIGHNQAEAVAVAYLDTDFYDSTRAALAALLPKVPKGGAMLIDDYGTWPGCRAATDEFFGGPQALGTIDDGCRVVHPC